MAPEWQDQDTSLLAWGTAILRDRWRILRLAAIVAVLAVLPIAFRPPVYTASASFVPQNSEQMRSGLASLAGQFGVSLGGGDQSLTPEFYTALLRSRVLLDPIVRDTFVVREEGSQRRAFLDLIDVREGSEQRRVELGRVALARMVRATPVRATGVVELSVSTRWPSVSLAVVRGLVDSVTSFNQLVRQSQAGAERRFVEERLSAAGAELRRAEDRLEQFLRTNRQFINSPQLAFERDRLQRDVALKQQVFTSLTDAHEEVRIRELRNTPVVSIVEPPAVAATPEPRGRLKRVLLGFMIGGFIGALAAITRESVAKRREIGDQEAEEFTQLASEVKGRFLRPVRRFTQR